MGRFRVCLNLHKKHYIFLFGLLNVMKIKLYNQENTKRRRLGSSSSSKNLPLSKHHFLSPFSATKMAAQSFSLANLKIDSFYSQKLSSPPHFFSTRNPVKSLNLTNPWMGGDSSLSLDSPASVSSRRKIPIAVVASLPTA